MKIYEFSGKGLALSSLVVVRAESLEEATRTAKQWAEKNCVPPESLEFRGPEEDETGLPQVIYGWNGDY